MGITEPVTSYQSGAIEGATEVKGGFQMKSVMFVRGLLAIVLLLALGALPGCGEKEQTQNKPATVSKEDVKKEVKEAYD
ncbi:MAG: hypothetical protein WBC36_13180, partial [Desulfobacterales bacterium]